MMKKLTYILMLVACTMTLFGGCAADLLRITEYQGECVFISFYKDTADYESENYRVDFDIIIDEKDDSAAKNLYDEFYGRLKGIFGESLSEKLAVNTFERQTNNTNLIRLNYSVTADDSFLSGEVISDEGLFFNSYRVIYDNPLHSMPLYSLVTHRVFGDLPAVLMIPASRRDKVYGGEVAAKDFSYWATWSAASLDALYTGQMETSFNTMTTYSWFAIAILAGVVVVAVILIFAKKEKGRMVAVPQRQVPYYRQQPPIDPFDSSNDPQNPFGI